MALPLIIDKVWREPWAIKPSVHHAIQSSLTAALNGERATHYDDDDKAQDGDELFQADGVSIIPISGIIGKHLSLMETTCGGVDVDSIGLALDAAVMDSSTDTILLYFDTAGGTVTGVPELADKIASASKVKRVVSYTSSLCASAGYWLASQAEAFYCSTSAEVGSIGVYLALLDESERLAAEGVKVNAFTGGKYKLAGSSFKPLTEEERELFQADVDYWYDQFKSAVLSKRQLADSTMQGQSVVGAKAVELNLVDGLVDSVDEVLSMTR